ncbi:class I SAM-dependent RNA methyltransferase [Candidatus Saccharibacteria bacterium]|nr:class I SAM-dependent RNA methyltransferase [Candidatus Saccharibacteria bacterium]
MIKVEKIIPGGQALGTHDDGRKIFFWNALPDELIEEFKITKKKTHYYEAIATKIKQPSSHRIAPKDECFLSTSPWQILDFSYENHLKKTLVNEIFNAHKIKIESPEIITDNQKYFYRNKMEYALYWNHGTQKIHLAFHARGSHQKIPIKQSSLERPEIFATAEAIVNNLNILQDEARRYQSLLLRCNQNGEVSGGLFEKHKPHPVFKNLTDQILGQNYSYSPNGFFQINLPVYELALKEIQKHIHTDKVLDLYAGVGTIGLSTARHKKLTLVESDQSAFSELAENCKRNEFEGIRQVSTIFEEHIFRQNCKRNGFEGIRSYDEDERADPVTTGVGDAPREPIPLAIFSKSENVTDFIEPDQTVILDPPRAGCDRKLIDKLNEIRPKTIIYLSCNPATQARDVKLLLENYQIKHIQPFNFFPRTPHIENLVVLC